MKKKKQIIQELLDSLPWVVRERMKEKVAQIGRARPLNQAVVERLYYQAIGYTEAEISRRMKMEMTLTFDCDGDVAMRLADMVELQAERLKANEAKGDWRTLSAPQILDQIRTHVHEMEQAVVDYTSGKTGGPEGLKAIAKATADLSNYSFFMADLFQAFTHED